MSAVLEGIRASIDRLTSLLQLSLNPQNAENGKMLTKAIVDLIDHTTKLSMETNNLMEKQKGREFELCSCLVEMDALVKKQRKKLQTVAAKPPTQDVGTNTSDVNCNLCELHVETIRSLESSVNDQSGAIRLLHGKLLQSKCLIQAQQILLAKKGEHEVSAKKTGGFSTSSLPKQRVYEDSGDPSGRSVHSADNWNEDPTIKGNAYLSSRAAEEKKGLGLPPIRRNMCYRETAVEEAGAITAEGMYHSISSFGGRAMETESRQIVGGAFEFNEISLEEEEQEEDEDKEIENSDELGERDEEEEECLEEEEEDETELAATEDDNFTSTVTMSAEMGQLQGRGKSKSHRYHATDECCEEYSSSGNSSGNSSSDSGCSSYSFPVEVPEYGEDDGDVAATHQPTPPQHEVHHHLDLSDVSLEGENINIEASYDKPGLKHFQQHGQYHRSGNTRAAAAAQDAGSTTSPGPGWCNHLDDNVEDSFSLIQNFYEIGFT